MKTKKGEALKGQVIKQKQDVLDVVSELERRFSMSSIMNAPPTMENGRNNIYADLVECLAVGIYVGNLMWAPHDKSPN